MYNKTKKKAFVALLAGVALSAVTGCKPSSVPAISLAGEWEFALDSTNVGIKEQWPEHSFDSRITLPGTTDEAGFGVPCTMSPSVEKPQVLHLTRKNSYLGPAWYTKEVDIPSSWQQKHIELSMERVIWETRVWVDGTPVEGTVESLVSPHRYDLSGMLTPGKHRVTVRVDNSRRYYLNEYDMAHAYTNDTQIMWNGIIGDISLTAYDDIRITTLQVYPDVDRKEIRIKGKLSNSGRDYISGKLKAEVHDAHSHKVADKDMVLDIAAGDNDFEMVCPMGDDVKLWSEFTPDLYNLTLYAQAGDAKAQKRVDFGMRKLEQRNAEFLLNDQRIFLRGTLECCAFPLTGRPPMDHAGWRKVFETAREWGLNHLRFHSWCPPEAAFAVADSIGFYLQVELPMWSLNVGGDTNMTAFLYDEADRILDNYGNHPSFCLFSMGNELQGDFNVLGDLLRHVKSQDTRRLYTTTSFTFQGGHGDWPEADDDYLVTQWTKKGWVRGQGVFDSESPTFNKDFSAPLEGMTVPLVTHEVGQYAVYPNLKEIDKYTGVLDPLNFKGVRQELERKGRLDRAEDYLKASGYLAYILYKEEIERAMKTAGCSGFQLLDLHDFPGQGTALVGLLDAFWESKGVVNAETFRQACSPVVPLARFPKAVYTIGETFEADVEVANYTDKAIDSPKLTWSLVSEDGSRMMKGVLECASLPVGFNKIESRISVPLSLSRATRLTLTIALENTPYKNTWSIWAYPQEPDVEQDDVVVTRDFVEAEKALAEGRKVLLNPEYKHIQGLEGKFVPVFWSPVHFPNQPGSMGILCKASHPAFADFPTGEYTDWQWWSLLKQSRTVVMDSFPEVTPLVEVVDNFVKNRRLSNLFEAKVGQGRLLFCSMDLMSDWAGRPEARQLYASLLQYMNSSDFAPSVEMTPQMLSGLKAE